jgi:bromodomain-containing factor 1
MSKAMRILRQCMRRKGSHFFIEAVDEEMFGITDYYKIITNPMYFQRIESKLKDKEYSSFTEFIADMHLVFDNCFLYNGLHHPVSQIAKQIKEYFESICKI